MSDKKDKKRASNRKGKMIASVLMLLPTIFNLVQRLITLVKNESYLAAKSIFIIIILGVVSACLLTATWVSLLAIIFLTLVKYQWGLISASIIIFLLNLLLLVIIFSILSQTKNNLSFPETRRILRSRHRGRE